MFNSPLSWRLRMRSVIQLYNRNCRVGIAKLANNSPKKEEVWDIVELRLASKLEDLSNIESKEAIRPNNVRKGQ
ncbi:hypothetical protein [Staphylococcus phage vB_SauH_DELF3]|nr:hypothetical protein [Staphylococcus phage vB_SauH_DELF3]